MLRKGDSVVIDFGEYSVGYLHFKFSFSGSHPDAPAYIRFHMAERAQDIDARLENYKGWLGKGWFQEEYVHIDILPEILELPRRYAFRYLKIEVLGTSEKYGLIIEDVRCESVTSADFNKSCPCDFVRLQELYKLSDSDAGLFYIIDKVALKTLSSCMQDVFEDGPKRDRRMWLGDLRLQAKVNHLTYKNEELVKRCLYLFAGLSFNEGKIAACLFTEPGPEPDDTYLMDYSLMFGVTLYEYYEATGDIGTLRELYPAVKRQTDIALSNLNEQGIIPDHSGEFWCFVDWGDDLNIQAASLAILVYGMMYEERIAKVLGDSKRQALLESKTDVLKQKAMENFWDVDKQLFVSGKQRQVSYATQVWMILAEIVDEKQGREILEKLGDNVVGMQSPYMNHYYVDALIKIGEKRKALEKIKDYWGGMIIQQADTFWEIYDPENINASPYGDAVMNSYCHAWSCTPAYFLRKLERGDYNEEN